MLIKTICVILSQISFNLYSYAGSFEADDILGYWLTKEERAVIKIYKKNKTYEGKLVWLVDIHTGKKKDVLDINNPEEKLKRRSLKGLINLEGFHFEDDMWIDGKIYDPNKGKTYSAQMELKDKDILLLRGYIGIPMFGRTSEWSRQVGVIPSKYLKK